METRTEDPRALALALIAEILEFEVSAVRGSDRLREDLGMDSLGSLELLSSIGQELKLEIELEDAVDLRTVDDACDFVEQRYAAARGAARVPAR